MRYAAKSFGIPTLTYNWSFPGGSPSTSTSANPVVTYVTNGLKSATLITCNSLGCDTITKTNVVNIDTPKAWLTNRKYTSYNFNPVLITIKFTGNPPYSVTLTDGTNAWTQSNIKANPYFFSIIPTKDMSLISISSFSDSSCVGNRYGMDTIYRVTLGGGGGTDCDTTNLNTGKVLHLDFNGNTQDKSGNGNHATNFGATSVAGKNGVVNTAYRFNGTNYMSVAHASSLNLSEATITAIVKTNVFNSDPCMGNEIFSKGIDNSGGNGRYCLRYSPVLGNCTNFGDTTQNVHYSIWKGFAGCPSPLPNSAPRVDKSKWHCIVATYKNDTLKQYLDGQLLYSCYLQGPLGSNTANIFIGKQNSTSFPYWLNADVDDIRVYNRALEHPEIKGYCGTCNLPSTPSSNCDTNLVVNGDFNAGNTGFNSDYSFCNSNNCLWTFTSNGYSIHPDPSMRHNLFAGSGYGGTGNFAFYNGGLNSLKAWEQTVNVLPNNSYKFSAKLASVYINNPAPVALYINNILIATTSAPASLNNWIDIQGGLEFWLKYHCYINH